jgi:hypothetical protein
MLNGRSFVAARAAARALPQLVARCLGAPADHRHGARQRCVVLAPLAIQPEPRRRPAQVAERCRGTSRLHGRYSTSAERAESSRYPLWSIRKPAYWRCAQVPISGEINLVGDFLRIGNPRYRRCEVRRFMCRLIEALLPNGWVRDQIRESQVNRNLAGTSLDATTPTTFHTPSRSGRPAMHLSLMRTNFGYRDLKHHARKRRVSHSARVQFRRERVSGNLRAHCKRAWARSPHRA